MYITIIPQKIEGNYSQSAADFVAYLEKENHDKSSLEIEHFFNQSTEEIPADTIIQSIDQNTAKLKRSEPKFYSITISPSRRELNRIGDSPEALKRYTRGLMKEYARAFNREIDGRRVDVKDILYYAKVERQRTYKGTDPEIRENQPYLTRLLELKHEARSIERGEITGDIRRLQKEINELSQKVPHRRNGQPIVRGMPKEGPQSHIHIIVSRKDRSNRYSLSPGSKYKASQVIFNGKPVNRGFDRDAFFRNSENVFDSMFGYNRNFVETYAGRNLYLKKPEKYFAQILGLPASEKALALKLLQKTGVHTAALQIPTSKAQLMVKAVKNLQKRIGRAIQAGSIEM